jgi:hypothetical protein
MPASVELEAFLLPLVEVRQVLHRHLLFGQGGHLDHLFSGERVAGGSLEDDSVVAEEDGAFGWEQRRTSQQTGTALFSSVGKKVHAQP